jgi:hypothetical protein
MGERRDQKSTLRGKPEHAPRSLREMYRSFAVRIIVSTVAQTNGTAIA